MCSILVLFATIHFYCTELISDLIEKQNHWIYKNWFIFTPKTEEASLLHYKVMVGRGGGKIWPYLVVAGFSTPSLLPDWIPHALFSLAGFFRPSSHWLDLPRPLPCLSIDCAVPTTLIVLFVTTNCKNLFKYITNIFKVKNVGTLLMQSKYFWKNCSRNFLFVSYVMTDWF